MHNFERELMELGIIDSDLQSIHIDEWFENAKLSYIGVSQQIIYVEFLNCFEISFKHDKTYSKDKNKNGELNYKYFVQNIEIDNEEDFWKITIDAWPLEAKIVCRDIEIHHG